MEKCKCAREVERERLRRCPEIGFECMVTLLKSKHKNGLIKRHLYTDTYINMLNQPHLMNKNGQRDMVSKENGGMKKPVNKGRQTGNPL